MTDLRLTDAGDGYWDLAWDDSAGDLSLTDDLETSVIVSLFTVARAQLGDLPRGSGERLRGWWGDAVPVEDGDFMGSRLWTLERGKVSDAILPRIRQIFSDALQWMVDDGVASSVRVDVSRYSVDIIAVSVDITRPTGDKSVFRYWYNWEAQSILHDTGGV